MSPISFSSQRGNSILQRFSGSPPKSTALSLIQLQADQLTQGFVDQAADWKSLTAVMAGGLAYRLGKIGVMTRGAGQISALPLRVLSTALGLGAEVTAFEGTNRTLTSLLTPHSSPQLWKWDGIGGFKQGLLSSATTFGLLKGAGHLAQGQNILLQHLFQDAAMVSGHQVLSTVGVTPKPEGTIAEQFVHAEATNFQMQAGMGLVHGLFPGWTAMERSLDLSLQSGEAPYLSQWKKIFSYPPSSLAIASAEETRGRTETLSIKESSEKSLILKMSSSKGDDKGGGEQPVFSKYLSLQSEEERPPLYGETWEVKAIEQDRITLTNGREIYGWSTVPIVGELIIKLTQEEKALLNLKPSDVVALRNKGSSPPSDPDQFQMRIIQASPFEGYPFSGESSSASYLAKNPSEPTRPAPKDMNRPPLSQKSVAEQNIRIAQEDIEGIRKLPDLVDQARGGSLEALWNLGLEAEKGNETALWAVVGLAEDEGETIVPEAFRILLSLKERLPSIDKILPNLNASKLIEQAKQGELTSIFVLWDLQEAGHAQAGEAWKDLIRKFLSEGLRKFLSEGFGSYMSPFVPTSLGESPLLKFGYTHEQIEGYKLKHSEIEKLKKLAEENGPKYWKNDEQKGFMIGGTEIRHISLKQWLELKEMGISPHSILFPSISEHWPPPQINTTQKSDSFYEVSSLDPQRANQGFLSLLPEGQEAPAVGEVWEVKSVDGNLITLQNGKKIQREGLGPLEGERNFKILDKNKTTALKTGDRVHFLHSVRGGSGNKIAEEREVDEKVLEEIHRTFEEYEKYSKGSHDDSFLLFTTSLDEEINEFGRALDSVSKRKQPALTLEFLNEQIENLGEEDSHDIIDQALEEGVSTHKIVMRKWTLFLYCLDRVEALLEERHLEKELIKIPKEFVFPKGLGKSSGLSLDDLISVVKIKGGFVIEYYEKSLKIKPKAVSHQRPSLQKLEEEYSKYHQVSVKTEDFSSALRDYIRNGDHELTFQEREKILEVNRYHLGTLLRFGDLWIGVLELETGAKKMKLPFTLEKHSEKKEWDLERGDWVEFRVPKFESLASLRKRIRHQ